MCLWYSLIRKLLFSFSNPLGQIIAKSVKYRVLCDNVVMGLVVGIVVEVGVVMAVMVEEVGCFQVVDLVLGV